MDRTIKQNLLLYMAISAATFSFLVVNERAGVSVIIFMAIQFVCLYLWAPAKKPLLMFIPLFILALNSFISANTMWRLPNLFVGLMLYSVMSLWLTGQVSLQKESLTGFVFKPLLNLFEPIFYFKMPVVWGLNRQKNNMRILRRIAIALFITVPLATFLLIMLARADAIFLFAINEFVIWLIALPDIGFILRVISGIAIGFYLFGMLYYVLKPDRGNIDYDPPATVRGDVLIINIVLSSVLFIYTVFVFIQFRYLFASPDELPFGLTFEAYARRGFFELMFLAAINIFAILINMWLVKTQNGTGAKTTKIMCFYLCAITSVLLVSSFYRMWLHGADDGLTRMRFLVFGFLIFKSVGIAATFAYIANPKFNIIAAYCVIALVYYLCLNIVPIDAVVARSQINRYLATGHGGVAYVLTLSPDIAPQLMRLAESGNTQTQNDVLRYFAYTEINRPGWRQWNLSANRFVRLRDELRIRQKIS